MRYDRIKDELKEELLGLLNGRFRSVRELAEKLDVSWEFANRLLKELEKKNMAEMAEIGNIKGWRLKHEEITRI